MEYTTGVEPKHQALSVWVFFMSLLLTVGFAIWIIAALNGFRAGDALLRPNPFAAYEALWPGQSLASVATFAQRNSVGQLQCLSGQPLDHEYPGLVIDTPGFAAGPIDKNLFCQTKTNDDIFDRLTMVITDDRVHLLELFSDVLPEDSLLLYWGAPDSVSQSGIDHSIYLTWNHSTYFATAVVPENESIVKEVMLTINN